MELAEADGLVYAARASGEYGVGWDGFTGTNADENRDWLVGLLNRGLAGTSPSLGLGLD